jgi:predicted transposase/invertase (TIGR01784 family)
LTQTERNSQFTDLIQFVIVELPRVTAKSDHTAKWGWARFFGSGSDAELREAAKESEKIGKAMLTIEKLSADENARVRADYEEIMRLDHISRMEGARSEGRAEGLAEGEAIGRVEGRAELEIEIAQRMAELGSTDAEIAKILGRD